MLNYLLQRKIIERTKKLKFMEKGSTYFNAIHLDREPEKNDKIAYSTLSCTIGEVDLRDGIVYLHYTDYNYMFTVRKMTYQEFLDLPLEIRYSVYEKV